MDSKAEMGVGTLIIFIALLLVAAIAAGVVIQTAGSLQQKALSTGMQATGQISTNAAVLEVSAVLGPSNLLNISSVMKLAPGSDPIQLSAVTYTFSTKNTSTTYVYSGSGVYSVNAITENGTFGIVYLQRGANWQNGIMGRGDVIRLDAQTPRLLTTGEDVRITFIPKIGTPTLTMFTIPDVVTTERVYLYP